MNDHKSAPGASGPKRLILSPLGKQALIRKARTFPIVECQITIGWQKDTKSLAYVVVARQHPDGAIIYGSYLVDRACLGVKDTLADAASSFDEYRQQFMARLSVMGALGKTSPELAHQLIYQSIDYANQFGFKPQKDYKMSQLVLEPRGQSPETASISFGINGKPLFIAGPYDNVRSILAKLDATAGPGNYDYILPKGPFG